VAEGGIFLSIVIPVYDEEGNIFLLYERLVKVLERIDKPFEIIYIDDGSTDRTWEIVRQIGIKDSRVRGVRFRRNFGQAAALSAGFSKARGEIVVSMDGDGQNAPEDIPRLLEKMSSRESTLSAAPAAQTGPGKNSGENDKSMTEQEGYDVVNGWRRDRKDKLFSRRIPSWIANRLIALLTGLEIHDFGCTLRAYRRDIIQDINLYGEMHRMIPVLAHWTGARIAEIEVTHHARETGVSKYSIGRTLNVILDIITLKFFIGYFTRPLHLFGLLGAVSLVLGLGAFAALILMKILSNVDMTGNPFLILGVLLFIIGAQLVMMGLLGEINIRTYYEAQNKPTYTIRESF